MDIMQALVRMLTREMNGGDGRGGDILERAVGKKKLGSGNASPIGTSNTTAGANPLFPNFAPAPMDANGVINPAFSPYNTVASNSREATPFQIRDLPPDVYTVHLSTIGQPAFVDNAHGIVLSTVATVIFSVDGRQATRKVNINQGIRICGQADSISITISDNTNLVTTEPYTTVKYEVVIGVSRGVRPDQQQPPTLYPYDANGFALQPGVMQLAPAGVLKLAVPQDIGIISTNTLVWDVTGPGGAIPEGKVSVTYANNGQLIAVFDPRVAPWIPIRPGTNEVILTNNFTDTVQFSLVYGIDG
jgi:hypothetical protein